MRDRNDWDYPFFNHYAGSQTPAQAMEFAALVVDFVNGAIEARDPHEQLSQNERDGLHLIMAGVSSTLRLAAQDVSGFSYPESAERRREDAPTTEPNHRAEPSSRTIEPNVTTEGDRR